MLDTFFKKWVWTVNLALLFAAAWLAARTVNTVVGAAVRPKPAVDLSSLPSTIVRPTEPVRIDSDKLFALIGLKPPEAPPAEEPGGAAAPAAAQTCADVQAAPSKSGLRVQLIAAVIAERPEWSLASITDVNTRETKIYGVGDPLLGAPILSVERIRDDKDENGGSKVVAIICNNGLKEYVDFEPGDGSSGGMSLGTSAVPAPHAVSAVFDNEGGGPAGGPSMEGIKKMSENRYEIKRSVIDNTLANLNNVATQARIVPSFKNGVSNGFKLFSIQPGSLYSSIGIENGDVIQRINGYEINSPDKALEVYQKLKESNHITVEVDRNGQVIRKEYNVGGP